MDKQEALNKIKELEEYIEGLDKKLVRVYVKEWETRPFYWNGDGDMDGLCGKVFDDARAGGISDDRVYIIYGGTEWSVRQKDVIFVEGSFADLED